MNFCHEKEEAYFIKYLLAKQVTYLSGHDGVICTHGYENHVVDLGDKEGGIVHITLQDHLKTYTNQIKPCKLTPGEQLILKGIAQFEKEHKILTFKKAKFGSIFVAHIYDAYRYRAVVVKRIFTSLLFGQFGRAPGMAATTHTNVATNWTETSDEVMINCDLKKID